MSVEKWDKYWTLLDGSPTCLYGVRASAGLRVANILLFGSPFHVMIP
jgi:hypothetical protein